MLTVERLRELLHYDPETGVFRWRITRCGRAMCGNTVGTNNGRGYLRVAIDGRSYLLHKLAWLYVYGQWPAGRTDHDDRNTTNNRINNLRPATDSQNQANARRRSDNKSGYKGVHWYVRSRKWCSAIKVNGKRVHLGYFRSPQEAHAAYCAAATKNYGEFACFG